MRTSRRRRRNLYYFFALFVLLLFLVLELFLPGFVSNRIEIEIVDHSEEVNNLKVSVYAFPSLKLIFSRADRVEITADSINYDGLLLKEVTADYENIIIENGEIYGKNTDLKLYIPQKNINNYLNTHYENLGDFDVNINPGQVFMKGKIKILGTTINVQLDGEFLVGKPNEIYFKPTDLKIEDLAFSRNFIERYVKDLGFTFDLSTFNFPINIEEIRVIEDEILLLGGVFVGKVGN